RPPLGHVRDAGLENGEPVHEALDLGGVAEVGAAQARLKDALGLLDARVVPRVVQVGQHHVAAGRQMGEQRGDDPRGVTVVRHVVDDRGQDHAHGTRQIDHPGQRRVGEDLLRLVQVALDEGRDAALGEQRPPVREDDRVVVDVDDPRGGVRVARELVHVRRRGQPRPDVDELVDAHVGGHVGDRALYRGPVAPSHHGCFRHELHHHVGHLAVGGEVVLAAEEVVVHARERRRGGVDARRRLLGEVVAHGAAPSSLVPRHSAREGKRASKRRPETPSAAGVSAHPTPPGGGGFPHAPVWGAAVRVGGVLHGDGGGAVPSVAGMIEMTYAGSAGEVAGGVAGWATDLRDRLGAPGAGLAIALETLFPPLPGEVILPRAGCTAAQGDMGLAAAMAWTTAGSVVGALVLYWVGVLVGRDRMRALVARLPLVKLDDLDRTEAWFARHGAKAVFFGRMVPIFRSLISVPAGLERMRMRTFLLYTTLGSALWNTAFITAGYVLGDNWRTVERYLGIYSKAVLALFVLAVAAFAAVRVVRSRR